MTMISKLPQLATTANQFHASAQKAFGQALNFARSVGNVLLDAKALIPHGRWEPWIEENCEFSTRTARGYMRVSENWAAIEAKRAEVPDLSLRGALKLVASPKLDDDSKRKHVADLKVVPLEISTTLTNEVEDAGEPVTFIHYPLDDERADELCSQQPDGDNLSKGWTMT